jgi:hypothetical protein
MRYVVLELISGDNMHKKIKSYLACLLGNDYMVSVAKSYQSFVVSYV